MDGRILDKRLSSDEEGTSGTDNFSASEDDNNKPTNSDDSSEVGEVEPPVDTFSSSGSDKGKTSSRSIHEGSSDSDEELAPPLLNSDFDEQPSPHHDDFLDFAKEETTSTHSNIHYIFNVQDVLADFTTGQVINNRALIRNLTKRGIRHITLVVDDNPLDIATCPLQVSALCEYLLGANVEIESVLQSADLFFAEAFGSTMFQPGDVYTKYRCPIERAHARIAHIRASIFADYSTFNTKRDSLYAKIFLDKWVEEKKLSLLLEDNNWSREISKIRESIMASALIEYEGRKIEINCEYILTHLFDNLKNCLKDNREEEITLSDLIEREKQTLSKEESEWQQSDELTTLDLKFLNLYFTQLTEYYNLCFRADLIINDRKQQPSNQIDDEESEASDNAPAFVSSAMQHTCGDIYRFFRQYVLLNKADADIFIDTCALKRDAVAKAHALAKFNHALFILCPPAPEGLQLQHAKSWPKYNGNMNNYEMRRDLINYFNGSRIKNRILNTYHHLLEFNGSAEYREKNYTSAALFLRIAYLLSPTEALLKKIMQVDKAKMRVKQTLQAVNNSFVASLWQDIKNHGGGLAHYKIVRLNLEIHRKQYPDLYVKNKPLFSRLTGSLFASSQVNEVDDDFKNNITLYLSNFARDYPDYADKCKNFLTDLKNCLSSSSYREHVEMHIKRLTIPMIHVDLLSPRDFEVMEPKRRRHSTGLDNLTPRSENEGELTPKSTETEKMVDTFHMLTPEAITPRRYSAG